VRLDVLIELYAQPVKLVVQSLRMFLVLGAEDGRFRINRVTLPP
jgi:hypothetical protein